MKSIIRVSLSCMPIAAAILVAVELMLSNQLAALGGHAGSLDGKILEAQQVQEAISAQVARATSLASLATRAQEAGFREPTRQQILTLTGSAAPVALAPNEP